MAQEIRGPPMGSMERLSARVGIRNKEVRLSSWEDAFSNEVLSP
jgi:hypothetical protein